MRADAMIRQSFDDERIDVVVPSYRRPELLEQCLRALAVQSHQPAAMIVVVRVDDHHSKDLLATIAGDFPALVVVEVTQPGVIAAMSAGASRSSSRIIAFTDDDARPRPDWLARIAAHFQDPMIGGVGGRDVIDGEREQPLTENVGRFSPTGKLAGNHHLGIGGARTVDVLKGVNMAFRAKALALPAPGVLRGTGAQVDWEVLTCAWARQHGWRLVYDSEVVVDHKPAPRRGADQRTRPERCAVFDAAYNSVVAAAVLNRHPPLGRLVYPIAVGTAGRPGAIRAAIALARGEREVLRRVLPAMLGSLVAASRLVSRHPRQSEVVVSADLLRRGRPSHSVPVIVLVAHDIHDQGGMERVCAELIRRSSDRADYIVVAGKLAPELRPHIRDWVRVRVPSRPFPLKFVGFWLLGGWAVRRTHADLVHTVGAIVPNRVDVASIHLCHAGFRASKGALASRGDSPLRKANSAAARAIALAAEWWSYRPSRLRAFAAVSEGVAQELVRHYPSVPISITPNGVDLGRFRPDAATRSAMREREDSASAVVALFVGGDWNRKGLPIALQALAAARSEGHDLRLWVVGRGDNHRFAGIANRLGIGSSVRFFGHRGETAEFYQAADMFVLPSAYETFSLVCFEAAACGLPLVIPPLSGARDIVGDDEGGLLVERSASSVSAALGRLAADPQLRTKLGSTARDRASAYTWEASVASMTDLYAQLMGSRP